MTRTRRCLTVLCSLLVALSGAVVLLVGGASPASACSCMVGNPATRAEADAQRAASDVVFTGRLVDRREPAGGPLDGAASTDQRILTFEVSSVYKGVASNRQQVRTALSGASCGLELRGDGPFLLFTTRTEDGGLTASLCGGATSAVSLANWPGTPPVGGTSGTGGTSSAGQAGPRAASTASPTTPAASPVLTVTGAGGSAGVLLAVGALAAAGLSLGAVVALRRHRRTVSDRGPDGGTE